MMGMDMLPGKALLRGKLRSDGRKEQPLVGMVHKDHIEQLDCTPEQSVHDSSLELQPLKVSAKKKVGLQVCCLHALLTYEEIIVRVEIGITCALPAFA